MTITGRLTADAVVNTTKDERKVVNFSVAVNETYKPKGGERVQVATFYSCSFWRSEKVAAYLKKGTLVEANGRIEVRAYVSKDGEAKAVLNCHINDFKFLAKPREVEIIGRPIAPTENVAANDGGDVPF